MDWCRCRSGEEGGGWCAVCVNSVDSSESESVSTMVSVVMSASFVLCEDEGGEFGEGEDRA
jgi:hypothetical protein